MAFRGDSGESIVAKDHYLVLGLSVDASQDQVKSAYREKAKLAHPDRLGGDCESFRNVQEAYEVLSDPQRRSTYDQRRESRAQECHAPWQTGIHTTRTRPCPVEPLRPRRPAPMRSRRSSAPFGHVWGSPIEHPRPAAAHMLDLKANVYLTQTEAVRGTRLTVRLPTRHTCPHCGGYGNVGYRLCWHCLGRGHELVEELLWIDIPGGISDGATARVSLASVGLEDTYLLLRFQVHG
jgi:molecular chaperone DnaJ